jgi:hypothetical protein
MMKNTALAAALALGTAFASAQQTVTPAEYWQQHAQDGYMTHEDAVMYPTPAGRTASAIDIDRDGRVSQAEWARHHGESSDASSSADSASGDADDNLNLADEARERSEGGSVPSTHFGNTGS